MTTEPWTLAYLWPAVVGFLLGSIPFGLLLTRAAGLGDIRKVGSGNIGATNVLRTGNKKLAAATLLLDALKGLAPVLVFNLMWGPVPAAARRPARCWATCSRRGSASRAAKAWRPRSAC